MEKMKMRCSIPGHQGGFTLIELLIVIGVMGVIAAMAMTEKMRDIADAESKALGVQLVQFESAVTAFVFDGGLTVSTGTYTGADWLKDATACGGSASGTKSYMPCGFPDTLKFGLTMETIISSTPAGFVAITSFGPNILRWRGEDKEILAAQAIKHAQTISSAGTGDIALSTFLTFSRVAGVITGEVDSVAGGNASPFLRLDGTNSPFAAIDWNGQNIFDINSLQARTINSGIIYDTEKQRTLSQSVQDVGIYEDGDLILKPRCMSSFETPEIFLSPFSFSAGPIGENIQGVLPRAIDMPGSQPAAWKLEFRVITPGGPVTPPQGYGLVNAFTKCT